MKLKTKIISILAIWVVFSLAHAQNYYFVMPVKGLVAQAQSVTYVSCKAVLDAGESTGSGVYTVDPTGTSPITTYCDMTTSGGGWTMAQYREYEKPFSFITDLGQHYSLTRKPYSYTLPDSDYIALRDQSTDLLYTNIQTSGYAVVGVNKARTQASCITLGNTLAILILLHDEVDGCTGTGGDFSNIGYKNTIDDYPSYIINLSNFFDSVSGDYLPSDISLREQGVLFFR